MSQVTEGCPEEEYHGLAARYSAIDLKQMVDVGLIPCVGAIKQKIEDSLELQLHQAMAEDGLSQEERLKLLGTLLLMMHQSKSTES